MIGVKARAVAGAAAALLLSAASLMWVPSTAAAYGQCVRTIPDDHYWVSVTCPTQPGGSQFRVKAYACSSMGSGCGSTPYYGAWVSWGNTSTASTGPYVDVSRISIEVSYV